MLRTHPDRAPRTDQTRAAWAVLAVAAGSMVLLPAAVTGTNVAFPEIEADFGSSRATLFWVLSGYSIVTAAFTLLGGQLSDRLGSRSMFLAGMVGFAAGSLLSALAPNVGLLIAGRVLQGMGAAVFVPASLAMVLPQFERARHPFVIGVWAAAVPIGSSLSPTFTAWVLEAGWRWVFGAQFLASAGLLAASSFQDADSTRQGTQHRPDYLGVVMGTAAFGFLALAIVQGPRWGWGDPAVVGAFAVAVVLMPAFLLRTRRMPQPLLELELFSIPTFRLANIVSFGVSMVGTSVWLLWPIHLVTVWGYSNFDVGLAITPTPFLAGAFSIFTGRWAQRVGYRGILIVGTVLLAVANLWFVLFYGTEPDYVRTMLPGLVLFGLAMGFTFAPLNGAALVDVPDASYGRANAAFLTGRAISGAIGLAILVAILGDASGPDAIEEFDRAFTFLGATSAVTFVVVVLAWPRRLRAG